MNLSELIHFTETVTRFGIEFRDGAGRAWLKIDRNAWLTSVISFAEWE